MKYVISVSKTYKHRGKHRHNRAKKHWFVYYYDDDERLQIKQINFLQALYYKTQKCHRITMTCPDCGNKWKVTSKKKNPEFYCEDCQMPLI